MPFCYIKDVPINFESAGEKHGPEGAMVFVHGAGGSAYNWHRQVGYFKGVDKMQVALDLPGHGRSAGNGCDQIFLYREWLRQFCEAMEIKKPVLAGHSMGGAIVMEYALRYPGEAEALLLIGTAPELKAPAAFLEKLKRGEYDLERAGRGYAKSTPADFVEKMLARSLETDPRVRYADYLACHRFKLQEEELAAINTPTLVICGTEDISTPPEASRYLAKTIPAAELFLLEEAAHNIILERPQPVNERIARFLDTL